MKLLVDQNLAARVAANLRDAGHATVQVSERGMSAAEDDDILAVAVAERRVLVSEDPTSVRCSLVPALESFVLIRAAEPLTSDERAALLIANLPGVAPDLEAGAIVVLGRGRVRVRPLPLTRPDGQPAVRLGTVTCVRAATLHPVRSGVGRTTGHIGVSRNVRTTTGAAGRKDLIASR